MDPIAIANSAIGVLQKVKQALDDCKEAFEEAKELRKAVDLFEVTIMMIPNKAQPAAPKASGAVADVERVGTALTVARDAAMERVNEVISGSPLGVVLDLFKLSPTGEPIFGEGPSPSEVLQEMKNTKIDDIRVYSDLEVMFAGMAFIIKSALESMSDATETLQLMNGIGEPSYLWLCTPWKIMQMKGVKETLAGHFDSLAKQTVALQSAIGVASYAVQLEQLENTLDATSVLTNLDMRDLWKKKLGIDRTRVPFSEFCDAFLSSVRGKVKEVRAGYIVEEKVGRFRAPCDVVLGRFLNELYNEDNDDFISAFELSHALDAFVRKGRKSVPFTTDHLLRKEVEFLNFIKFLPVALPDSLLSASRKDPLSGLVNAEGEVRKETVYPYEERADGVILVRPFHRVLLRADVPVMDDETFPYDHLIMLKYRYNPLLKPSAVQDDDVDEVSEVKFTKTYVHEATNELMLGRRDTSWNAFRTFTRVESAVSAAVSVGGQGGGGVGDDSVAVCGVDGDGGEVSAVKGLSAPTKRSVVPPGFSESANFEEIDREELLRTSTVTGTGGGGAGSSGSVKFKPDPFVTPTRILYVPYVLEPGYYSPRFCVDAYDGDARNKQKMAKSAKSYYRSFASALPYCASTDEVKKEVTQGCAGEKGNFGGDFGGGSGDFSSGSGDDEANLVTAREAAYNESARIAAYNRKLGVLVKCVDVLELVFAEDIALESQFHEDGDDSDNDNDNDNADIVQKTGFRPQLSRYYPYLPDRELESYAPMDVEVYVNIPRRGVFTASAAFTEEGNFVPSKIALFLCPAETLVEKSIKSVASRTKRYKYSKSLLKEVVEGLFGGDTGVTVISFLIGFVDESGKKRLPNSPAVTLAFDERAEENAEEEYLEEEEEDEENALEDDGEETTISRAAQTANAPLVTSPSSPRKNPPSTSSAVSPGGSSHSHKHNGSGPASGSSKGGASGVLPRGGFSSPAAASAHTSHTSVKVSSPRVVASLSHTGAGASVSSKHSTISTTAASTITTTAATVTAPKTETTATTSATASSPRLSTDPPLPPSFLPAGPNRAPSFGITNISAPRAMAPPNRPGSIKTATLTTNTSAAVAPTATPGIPSVSLSRPASSPKTAEKRPTASITSTASTAASASSADVEEAIGGESEVSVKKRVQKIEVVRSGASTTTTTTTTTSPHK